MSQSVEVEFEYVGNCKQSIALSDMDCGDGQSNLEDYIMNYLQGMADGMAQEAKINGVSVLVKSWKIV